MMGTKIETEHKRLNRLSISAHGMAKCIRILSALEQVAEDDVLYEAALSYAIILYACPFTENERNPGANALARIKDKALVKGLEQRYRELHQKILELRNTALAHAEWQTHPTRLGDDFVISSRPFSIMSVLQDTRIGEFRTLVEHMHIAIENERATTISFIQYLADNR